MDDRLVTCEATQYHYGLTVTGYASKMKTLYKRGDVINCVGGHIVRVCDVYDNYLNGTVISDTSDGKANSQMHKGGFPRIYDYEILGLHEAGVSKTQ